MLIALGLVARLAGLCFNGMSDLDQIIFSWGSHVEHAGLAKGFAENYGILSYALYGLAARAAEFMPRFWWAPYKAMEIGFEFATFFTLRALLPKDKKDLALFLYWLNPWFILHGAYQGFWEGPHTLSALAALWVLRRSERSPRGWLAAGMLLMAGAMFKPQALFYFVLPAGIYLGLRWVFKREPTLLWFSAGALIVAAAAAVFLEAGGVSWRALPNNYWTSVRVMPNLCNECVNVWRPVTRALMEQLGQTGLTTRLRLPMSVNAPIHAASFAVALGLVAVFGRSLMRRFERPGGWDLYLVMTFAAVAIPQLATKAHINHGYAGLVLLIPVIAVAPRVLLPWSAMVAVHFYAHLADMHLGRAYAHDVVPENFPWGRELIARVNEAFARPDALVNLHAFVNGLVEKLPLEPVVTELSVVQFLFVLYLLKVLFDAVRGSGTEATLG